MADIIVWFDDMHITFPNTSGSVEELTELYRNAMQNDACNALVINRTEGSHIIQKSHVLMIEVKKGAE